MKIRININNISSILLYIAFVVTYLITLLVFGMGEAESRYRYFLLAIAIVISFIHVVSKYGILFFKKKLYGKELFYILITGIVFWVMSRMQAEQVGRELNFRTYVQIALVVMPAMYVFCLTNLFSIKTIINVMKFTLIGLIIIYFCEPTHRIIDFFYRDNWRAVSFFRSTSFTESSLCAEPFLQLFLFFNFFRNYRYENGNKKSTTVYCYIALLFTLLSFKRLAIVFAICMLMLNRLIDLRGEISSKFVWVFSLFFTIATYFYTQFMQGTLFSGFDVYHFTSGRDYILSLWAQKNYLSYGYGSSMLIIGRYLEMDLVQIYLELNLLALFIFCFAYFKLARKNVYSFIIMTYAFSNMLTASSLPYSLGWIILLLTIICLSSDKCENENMVVYIRKQRVKRLFSKNSRRVIYSSNGDESL